MKTTLLQQLIQDLRKVVRGFASACNANTISSHYPTPLHTVSVHVPSSHYSSHYSSHHSSHYYPATHYCIRGPEAMGAT